MISMGSSSSQGSVAFASAPTQASSLRLDVKSSTRPCRAVAAAAAASLLSKLSVPPPSPNLLEDVLPPWFGVLDGLAAVNDVVNGVGGSLSKVGLSYYKYSTLLSKPSVPPPSPNLLEDVLPWFGVLDGLAAVNEVANGAERGGGGGRNRSNSSMIGGREIDGRL